MGLALYNESKKYGKRLIIVIRGTKALSEWVSNTRTQLVEPTDGSKIPGKVHGGFWEVYTSEYRNAMKTNGISLRRQILRIVSQFKNSEEIFIVGHSLGAAIASIVAFEIKLEFNLGNSVRLITAASPHVGDTEFKLNFDNKFVKYSKRNTVITTDHVKLGNDSDLVTYIPVTEFSTGTNYTPTGARGSLVYEPEKQIGNVSDKFAALFKYHDLEKSYWNSLALQYDQNYYFATYLQKENPKFPQLLPYKENQVLMYPQLPEVQGIAFPSQSSML